MIHGLHDQQEQEQREADEADDGCDFCHKGMRSSESVNLCDQCKADGIGQGFPAWNITVFLANPVTEYVPLGATVYA